MTKKIISQRKKLAAIFASFSILIMGTASLLESMSLDYYSVLSTLSKVVPATIALGSLGWVMGMILDKPRKKRRSLNYSYLSKISTNDVHTPTPIIDDVNTAIT